MFKYYFFFHQNLDINYLHVDLEKCLKLRKLQLDYTNISESELKSHLQALHDFKLQISFFGRKNPLFHVTELSVVGLSLGKLMIINFVQFFPYLVKLEITQISSKNKIEINLK